ncbi:MAG: enoyl-CoA hydratase-related protein, partial [Pseudonocardia sp.]|nr:enoyl-CoA hydratase-related protein [Pseudonocardia sp.]
MTDRVTCTVSGGVADVRLNRPGKRNALDPAMFAALVETGTRLLDDRTVRAVVLSGEGPDFCAGLDTAVMGALARGERRTATVALPPYDGPARATGQRAAHVWAEIGVPVIAAVRGNALGGEAATSMAASRTSCQGRRRRCGPDDGAPSTPDDRRGCPLSAVATTLVRHPHTHGTASTFS